MTGKTDPIYNSLSGYYTLPNETGLIIKNNTSWIHYDRPTITLKKPDTYPTTYDLFYTGDNTIKFVYHELLTDL